LTLSALQSRLARAATGLGVRDAAMLADLSPETITRLEKNEAIKPITLDRIETLYRFLGVIFIDDAEKPGVLVDIARLSSVRSGAHDADYVLLYPREGRGQLNMLGTFLSKMELRRK
jgi:transcriptional regulator with XRE-family HTH domain